MEAAGDAVGNPPGEDVLDRCGAEPALKRFRICVLKVAENSLNAGLTTSRLWPFFYYFSLTHTRVRAHPLGLMSPICSCVRNTCVCVNPGSRASERDLRAVLFSVCCH